MMNEAIALHGLAFMDCLFQRIEHKGCVGCSANPPTHDIASKDINHEDHVDEPGPCGDLGEV